MNLLKNNEIDFAFVCGGAYIDGNSEFGMKILVAPEVNGNTTYHSYIIVHNNSNYTNLIDLRGKKFAFTDPLSNSGKLIRHTGFFLLMKRRTHSLELTGREEIIGFTHTVTIIP